MSSRWTRNRRDKSEFERVQRSTGIDPNQNRSRSPNIEYEPMVNDGDMYQDNNGADVNFNRFNELVSDEEDVDNAEDNPDPADIGRKLASWHLEYNISERAMNDLLVWLKKYHFPQLPKTIKSLKTEAKLIDIVVKQMEQGDNCYFELGRMLNHILTKNAEQPLIENCGKLQFGIDGVPLTKSSGSCFWPILVKIKEYPDVLPVAVYHGNGKPPDVHIFMEEFIQELDLILKNGLQWNNMNIHFELSAFIMDAPAKSYVLDIKGHTGFYACPKCNTRGENVDHRTTFTNISFLPLRTDESFLELTDGHHLRTDKLPPLASIDVGCISKVPIDYMHNVLLGVFRSLLKHWLNNSSDQFHLDETRRKAIDRRILLVKKQICSDFVRKPRPLTDIKWFKATELRLILLYLGPFIFVDVLDERYYKHFIKLHCAVRILCHPIHYRTMNQTAKNMIEAFARDFMHLYGEKYFVYNYHVLTHLADDCMLHGPLDQFSAFPFENYMQIMLHYIKKAPCPLQQFKNRLSEHLKYTSESRTPVVRESSNSFTRITNNKNMIISADGNDRFVCDGNDIYVVSKITKVNDRYKLNCNKMTNLMALYLDPENSKTLGVYCSGNFSYVDEQTTLDADTVLKVLHIHLDTIYGFVVLLHTNS